MKVFVTGASGQLGYDVCRELGNRNFEYRGRDFVIRNSLRDSRNYSMATLRASIACLADTDLRIKSSRADSSILLEQAVTRLLLLAEEK